MNIKIFKNGAPIHIKKSHEGSFTNYCGGEVTDACIQKAKKSSNPKLRKKAVFAENARSWSKHQYGGSINGAPNKYQMGTHGEAIPNKRKEEIIKANQKRYPGITREQAAGEETVSFDHHRYYIDYDGTLLPLAKRGKVHHYAIGGAINKFAWGGFAKMGNIANKVGNFFGTGDQKYENMTNTIQAGVNMVTGAIDSIKNGNKAYEEAQKAKYAESDNRIAGMTKDKADAVAAQQQTLNSSMDKQRQSLQALADSGDAMAKEMLKYYNGNSAQLSGPDAQQAQKAQEESYYRYQKAKQEEITAKEAQAQANTRMLSGAGELVNQASGAIKRKNAKKMAEEEAANTSKVNVAQAFLDQNMNDLYTKADAKLSLKTGGSVHKAFGNFASPTDDCQQVSPRTKKLIKRNKNYHRYVN